MPVRGSRKLYKIPEIQVGETAGGTGGRPVVVKMKEPIADFLNLTPMAYNDPELIGTFGGSGSNAGYKYIKRVGGFRYNSFKIVANTQFLISEIVKRADGTYGVESNNFRSISIGFPRGVSVREFVYWLGSTGIAGEVSHVVTPSGVSFPMGASGS